MATSKRVRRIIAASELQRDLDALLRERGANLSPRQPHVIRPHVLGHNIAHNTLPVDAWLALTQRGYIIR